MASCRRVSAAWLQPVRLLNGGPPRLPARQLDPSGSPGCFGTTQGDIAAFSPPAAGLWCPAAAAAHRRRQPPTAWCPLKRCVSC